MGLDQYLYTTDIPQEFFEIAHKYGSAFSMVVNGFYASEDDSDVQYVYYRKEYPIDTIIRDHATWADDYSYYYIAPDNALKLKELCARVVRMIPFLHDLTTEELAAVDITKTIDEIIFRYPPDSPECESLKKQISRIIPFDSYDGDSLSWDLPGFFKTISLIETFKGNGLFYIRSF
jgi:hypothetical protein